MTHAVDQFCGYASDRMYSERWSLIQPHIRGPEFVLVDWGSDAGWFSLKIAEVFPRSTVISVESGIMSNGKAIQVHREKLRAHNIKNNILVESLFGPDTFTNLKAVPSDYQLVLSVFHHVGNGYGRYIRKKSEWDFTFCSLVSGSKTTFLEIPNEDSPHETPLRIREWYAGRDVETVIRTALREFAIGASVEFLGETQHGMKGRRKLFKISLDGLVQTAKGEEISRYIQEVGKTISMAPSRRFRLAAGRVARKVPFMPKRR